jgi:hypothetical protein
MKAGLQPSILALLALVTLACGGGPQPVEKSPAADVPTQALERARGAADALGGELMQRLLAELSEGGPVRGVRVCSEVAPAIAGEHSRDGLTIRRVSLKARNPADVPDAWERAKLEELESLHADGRMPKELYEVADGATLRYLRPIVVVQPCLKCHGRPEDMDPEVVEVIRERYPDDQATGYARGDLRGAFTVSVNLP